MSYTIYGYTLSYFTRKIEAAFTWYGLDAKLAPKTLLGTPRIEKKGGTHQVPVVCGPEGDWHRDTTLIIEVLDGRHPNRRLIPNGEPGALVRLVEEWLDEWLPRTVIHYRWNIPENAAFAGARLGAELMPWLPGLVQRRLGKKVAHWGRRAVRSLALDDPRQREAVEAELARTLAAAETQLQETPYLLGDRPTAADAALLGGLRAHIGCDPSTARILAAYPTLLAWMDAPPPWNGEGQTCGLEAPTAFARFVLEEARGAYQTFIVANASALEAGKKAFMVTLHGAEVSVLARRDPERSRAHLKAALSRELDGDAMGAFNQFIDEYGLMPAFGTAP